MNVPRTLADLGALLAYRYWRRLPLRRKRKRLVTRAV